MSARLFTVQEVLDLRYRYAEGDISIRTLALATDNEPVTLKRLLYGHTYTEVGGPIGPQPKVKALTPARYADRLQSLFEPAKRTRRAVPPSPAVLLYREEKARRAKNIAPLIAEARVAFRRITDLAETSRVRRRSA